MRLMSFETTAGASWGMATDSGVIDLGARQGRTLLDIVQAGAMLSTVEASANLPADFALADINFLPPIHAPEKIACIGVNYANRNAEYKDNSADPDWPSLFMRTIDSFTGHDQPLWRPPESHQLDYEGEIVIVVGKAGHRIPQSEALDYIGGVTIMNEGTLRDWVRHAKFNVTQGKNFVHSGGLGPWIVPNAGQFGQFDDMTVTTRVNGEQRQHDTTANLMFPFSYLIHYLSTFFILKPGDIISTGTPLGAGARFEPPKYLVPGDVVEVEVPGVGILSNGVEDDPTVD
jgi:2-keto-4-pentenoate hydratase/2-oxohepta-3-ene-1,7-dioic acid hydratase in catechol pathway